MVFNLLISSKNYFPFFSSKNFKTYIQYQLTGMKESKLKKNSLTVNDFCYLFLIKYSVFYFMLYNETISMGVLGNKI